MKCWREKEGFVKNRLWVAKDGNISLLNTIPLGIERKNLGSWAEVCILLQLKKVLQTSTSNLLD